jgi:hypothetical protein
MVLRLLANGPAAVEEVGGIEALENVQFGEYPPELQAAAAALTDKVWGVGVGVGGVGVGFSDW